MRIFLKIFLVFFIKCICAVIADTSPQPYVIREPIGPETADGIELEVMKNLKMSEKEVRLNLGWEFESSTTINDIRSIIAPNFFFNFLRIFPLDYARRRRNQVCSITACNK